MPRVESGAEGCAVDEIEASAVQDDPLGYIAQKRDDIARIDEQILSLVAQRLRVAEEIGRQKRRAGLPVRNYRAEVDVLRRARSACQALGVDPDIGDALFQVLIEAAVGRQHELISERHGRPDHRSVAVVGGCGRMGVWLSHFFASQGHQVAIYDPSDRGMEGFTRLPSLEAVAASADVIVLSTPIGATRETLERLLAADPRGLIFDICSLKSPIVSTLQEGAASGRRVASVHPLFAPDSILLTGRILLVCDCGNPDAAADARRLFEDTALRLIDIPLLRHDEYMANVLGLSHAVNIAFARALAGSGLGAHALDDAASTTFSKQSRTTREVAMENPRLYYEIQHFNAHTAEVLDRLTSAVRELKSAALQETPVDFEALMSENRRYFESAE